MSLEEIRKLGDPLLYEKSEPVEKNELEEMIPTIEKMWDLIIEFRNKYSWGRAIAAPQVGLLKRIICVNTDEKYVLINPVVEYRSDEKVHIWDDCMSFPELMVNIERHRNINISFLDINWEKQIWVLDDDMSEVLQHELDHLDGILATDRASDNRSFKWHW